MDTHRTKQRLKLMIPGPVEVEPRVLEVMGRPLEPHYEAEFARIHAGTIGQAKAVFQTEGDLFVMGGSGTTGLEACLRGLTGDSGSILVLVNGVFAGLLSRIARSYSNRVEEVEFSDREPIPPEALDRLLAERRDVRAVAVVYSETHTGLLNPVWEYGPICRAHGAYLMVDAISALGGARLEMDAWQIDLCVTASQKALGAPPGLCLVAVNPRCWPLLNERATGPGYYLNLSAWRERAAAAAGWHPTLSTMAVPNFLALRQALHLVLEEGLEARFARHRRISLLVRQAVRSLGLDAYVPDEVASPTVTTILLPEGLAAQDVRDTMARAHGIMIAGANIPCRERAVRMGHMGPQATVENVVATLIALEASLREAGWAVSPGQALVGVDPVLLG